MFDVAIVGSGMAGTSAAYALRGKKVLMLDVGYEPEASKLPEDQSVRELKREGKVPKDAVIGENFESLQNVFDNYISPKLKAPEIRYVTKNWKQLVPVESSSFDLSLSFAKGGFANAWGAGVYRFTDDELKDFPISLSDLSPHYDTLGKLMGISGSSDDLKPFLGTADRYSDPLILNSYGSRLLSKYERKKEFFQQRHMAIGKPRLAVLTEEHNGRKAYDYTGREYFTGYLPSIYNPVFTLNSLIDAGELSYQAGCLVQGYEEKEGLVEVQFKDLNSGEHKSIAAKKLVLAAGAIGSARIALQANNDFTSKLPVRENMISYVPLLDLPKIGSTLEKRFTPIQLLIFYNGPLHSLPVVSSVFGMAATLNTDYLFDFPLAAKDVAFAGKCLVPAMTIIQTFYPDIEEPRGWMKLKEGGGLKIDYDACERSALEKHYVSSFLRAGYISHPALCKYPEPGNCYHYAGTLPMSREPKSRFETHPDGRLNETEHVYVADPANFSKLPSKNLTFTNGANAMRVGTNVLKSLRL